MARTHLSRGAYLKLAESGALDTLVAPPARDTRARTGRRRDALWAVREIHTRLDEALRMPSAEGPGPRFVPLSDHEEVLWDYRRSHHSTRGHPLQGLRPRLRAQGLPTAAELNQRPHGTPARYVGMAICRQRPGTASGVTFYTLEDETGFVNLVVWLHVFERHHLIARTALLLGVTGHLQVEHEVVHLVAEELWEPQLAFDPQGTTTRSFH
jgi:error-prone DNA polymerase